MTLNLKVGQIPVTFADKLLWMKQIAPTFGATRSPVEVAPVLNLDVSDFDMRFPIQEVSTGLWFLLAPLKNLDAVRRARVNQDCLKSLIATLDAKMIFLFAPETYYEENQINARMFGDELGVPEDSATAARMAVWQAIWRGIVTGARVRLTFAGNRGMKYSDLRY